MDRNKIFGFAATCMVRFVCVMPFLLDNELCERERCCSVSNKEEIDRQAFHVTLVDRGRGEDHARRNQYVFIKCAFYLCDECVL